MNFNIWLRALKIEDAKVINGLRMNSESENLIGGPKRFVSLARDEKWIQDLILSDNIDKIYLAISEIGRYECLGYTSISEIDYRNRNAFWSGIKIIPEITGSGYGFQSELLILKYCFEELNLQRVTAQALEEHVGALRLMEKAGFKKEGLMRKNLFKNGEYKNIWLLSILKEEYEITKDKYGL